ncbi:MAG: hypothetical protein U0166_11160 [Acidobacteriota bacterium]
MRQDLDDAHLVAPAHREPVDVELIGVLLERDLADGALEVRVAAVS